MSEIQSRATHRIDRREFIHTVAAGAGAAALSGCGADAQRATDDASQATRPWVKDPDPFIQHPTNLETRLESLHGFLTPNRLFFVRNHAPTPRVDAATYRLRIEGDAIEHPIALTYDDLLNMPSSSVIAYLECAGNWRSFFDTVLNQPARGGQWGTGAVGCAEWSGVPLKAVLERAGLKSNAVDVDLIGLDDGAFSRPLPIEKAMESTTLLAYAMNGDTLPPDHGFPVRGVVPGWAGSNSIKWLGRIVVSSEKIWSKNNTTSYVLIGPEWPAEEYAPADGGPITTLTIKSAIALPRPAALAPGAHILHGFAHSAHGRIAHVDWSADQGSTWHRARLLEPVLRHAWARFEFDWNATSGSHTLMVRATNERGNRQPDSVPFNEKGYLLNIPLPHPIEVA